MHTIVTLWPVARQTFLIYLFLIVALRVIGRGRLGQLTVIDLITVLLLGTCVETSMVAFNNHLSAGLVSAGTLLLANRLFSFMVSHSKLLKALVNADPMLLVNDGVIVKDHLRKSGMTEAQLLEAIREREHGGLDEVKYAILETDGEINVISRDIVVFKSRLRQPRQSH